MSGKWATKELCENGLKSLVLERGRMVEHIKNYTTAHMDPWDFPNSGQPTKEMISKQGKQGRTNYTTKAASAQWFVNDLEHPYNGVDTTIGSVKLTLRQMPEKELPLIGRYDTRILHHGMIK